MKNLIIVKMTKEDKDILLMGLNDWLADLLDQVKKLKDDQIEDPDAPVEDFADYARVTFDAYISLCLYDHISMYQSDIELLLEVLDTDIEVLYGDLNDKTVEDERRKYCKEVDRVVVKLLELIRGETEEA